jgi:hypothetical protein
MASNKISSIIDENIEAAECGLRLSDNAVDCTALGYVALKQDGSPTCLLDVTRHAGGFLQSCSIMDRNVAATAPERTGNRRADPAAGACDQTSLLLEVAWKHQSRILRTPRQSPPGQQKWKGDLMKRAGLLKVWCVTCTFDDFKAGARDPIAHLSSVFRRPSPIMPALDDQGRNGN